MNPSLVLIGTIHLDPSGYSDLISVLHRLKPKTVTVDVSPYALSFRQNEGKELLSRLSLFQKEDKTLPPELELIAKQLDIPFEMRAAQDYALSTGRSVFPIGDNNKSRQYLSLLVRELMTEKNLKALTQTQTPPLSKQLKREVALAHRYFRTGRLLGTSEKKRLLAQDRRMARQIKRHMDRPPLVHLCGWEHLAGLTRFLEDLKPKAELLMEMCSIQKS